jgi:hypothetical protein
MQPLTDRQPRSGTGRKRATHVSTVLRRLENWLSVDAKPPHRYIKPQIRKRRFEDQIAVEGVVTEARRKEAKGTGPQLNSVPEDRVSSGTSSLGRRGTSFGLSDGVRRTAFTPLPKLSLLGDTRAL